MPSWRQVGYGDRTPGTAFGKVLTSVAIVGGVLFMAMPITIVGSSFAEVREHKQTPTTSRDLPRPRPDLGPTSPPQVWEHKETKDVVRKMQEMLLERGLRATDVLTVPPRARIAPDLAQSRPTSQRAHPRSRADLISGLPRV
jgi:hypothetical protein